MIAAFFDRVRDRLAYQPILLGSVALAATAALTLAYQLTREPIAAAEKLDLQQTLAAVLPPGAADNDLLNDTLELPAPAGDGRRIVYLAKRAGVVTGAVFRVAERGYSGDISVLMAVGRNGAVLGVRVLKHTETPGLGDKIELARNPWITGFNGKSLGNPVDAQWAVKKDGGVFDAFAGATITPRAVVKAVKGGLIYFDTHRARIFGGTP